LRGPHRSGHGWTAKCPAHEDSKPSLSITQQNGKILLHCFAGCTIEAICAQLGIPVADLSTAEDGVLAAYDYTDEHGKLLYQVLRYAGKDFKQRKPDGKGQWIWKLGEVRRVLYHLPEIIPAELVLVVEGEKDVECARKLGLVATTNPGGANKWKPQYSETLKSKQVIIIPDADPPGRQHAHEIALSLVHKASSIKMLTFDGAKDLSEWVERGGTADQLLAEIATSPEWKEAQPVGGPLAEEYSCSEFLAADFSDSEQPLLAGLINRRSRTLIIGKPKMMKSLLAFDIAFEAACGFRVLGRYASENGVRSMYAQFEDPRGQVKVRLKKFITSHNNMQPSDGMFHIFIGRGFDLMEQGSRTQLEIAIKKFQPELLVLDVMRSLFVGDINKTADVRPFLEYLDTLCERFKCALMLVHYTAKNVDNLSAAGSTYLDGWPDLLIHVRNKRRAGKATLAEVQFLGRSSDLDPITIKYDENETPILSSIEGDADSEAQELSIARKFLHTGWGIREVAEVLGYNYQTARRRIEKWLEAGQVVIKSGGRRGARKRFEFTAYPEAEL